MDRLAGLKSVLELNPNDTFARYGLAMELARLGQNDEALEHFDLLLQNDPQYTAGYSMSAQTLASLERPREAVERLKSGIACAQRAGNAHAASEMQSLLDELDR